MRILVIDDEREFSFSGINVVRDKQAYRSLSEEDAKNVVYYARNYNVAQRSIADGWDLVYLDHDLGEEKNGYDIAKEIEAFAHNGDLLDIGRFIIVSANPVGRMNMSEALRKFYNVEFARAEDLQ